MTVVLPHHVIKRAQGSSDFDLDRLIALCRDCHAKTDAPFRKRRLVITRLGDSQYQRDLVHRGKWPSA